MKTLPLTDKNFDQEVLNSKIPVLVDFWSSWCPPCKMIEPIIEKLTLEYEGKVKVGKINVDQNRATLNKYNIKGVPTFIIFKDGQEIDRLVASQTENQLKNFIQKVINK